MNKYFKFDPIIKSICCTHNDIFYIYNDGEGVIRFTIPSYVVKNSEVFIFDEINCKNGDIKSLVSSVYQSTGFAINVFKGEITFHTDTIDTLMYTVPHKKCAIEIGICGNPYNPEDKNGLNITITESGEEELTYET